MSSALASRSSPTAIAAPVVTVFSSIAGIADRLRKASSCDGGSSSTNIKLLEELVEIADDPALSGFGGTVEFDPARLTETTKQHLRQAEILITEPSVLASLWLLHQKDTANAPLLPNLKWVQSTYAGVDPLLPVLNRSSGFPFTLTRFAGKFGPPIAEWCLARIIGHERNFAASAADQKERAWAKSRLEVTSYRYLSDLTLTVLGCGDIGLCIARAAKAFGMRVVGYVRGDAQNRNDGVDPPAADLYTNSLPEALREADYLVSVLPSTPSTVGLLSGDALQPCHAKSPVLLNVGRGSVIDEASLLRVLELNYISAAILDVFEPEPLPAESPLWDHPQVVVSPHVSGLTRGVDVPALFLQNYERYCQGQELLYAVDWSKGY